MASNNTAQRLADAQIENLIAQTKLVYAQAARTQAEADETVARTRGTYGK
jgi:hypothetical protein